MVEILPVLRSGRYPWHSFLLEAESTPDQSATGRIKSTKNPDNRVGNRPRDLSACSALPQPTAPQLLLSVSFAGFLQTSLIDEWVLTTGEMELTADSLISRGRTCTNATFSTINLTWSGPRPNSGLRQRPANTRLSNPFQT
jgi:hypothetical protein